MNENYIKRKIDPLGRVTIPKDYMKLVGFKNGDEVEFTVKNNVVYIGKCANTCVFCEKKSSLRDYKGKWLCKTCLKGLKGN